MISGFKVEIRIFKVPFRFLNLCKKVQGILKQQISSSHPQFFSLIPLQVHDFDTREPREELAGKILDMKLVIFKFPALFSALLFQKANNYSQFSIFKLNSCLKKGRKFYTKVRVPILISLANSTLVIVYLPQFQVQMQYFMLYLFISYQHYPHYHLGQYNNSYLALLKIHSQDLLHD